MIISMADPQHRRSSSSYIMGVTTNDLIDEVYVDIPPEIDQRRIYRVSPYMRGSNVNQEIYDPVVLSLGPYHHGRLGSRQMEEIKENVLNKFVSDSIAKDATKDRGFFHREIMNRINEIRNNYEEVEYNNEELATIILRDACYLIRYMEVTTGYFIALDLPSTILMRRDIFTLENQIPFWVIKRLLDLQIGEDAADKLVCDYLNATCYLIKELTTLPWKDDKCQPPLHLLEALRIAFLNQEAATEANTVTKPHFLTQIFEHGKKILKTSISHISEKSIFERVNLPCRSVTYLQSKGIHFKPSSQCLKDIKFTSYHFYGVLHLPILLIDSNSKVFFSNIITFEMFSKEYLLTGGELMSYIHFMKPLIDTPKDVKELRERGILYSTLGNDEEVVNMFKEIDTYGMNNPDMYNHVKRSINKHCRSKAKTWIADLVYDYCHSPWTAMAIFVTTFILLLTFIQTYYTIHPISKT